MSPNPSRKQRLPIIMKHITTCKYDEIAKLCGVTEKTIQRDIKRWKKNGGFSDFILKEFFELYGVLKRTNNKYVFDRICDLIRLNKNLFEVTSQEDGPIFHIEWVGKPSESTNSTRS